MNIILVNFWAFKTHLKLFEISKNVFMKKIYFPDFKVIDILKHFEIFFIYVNEI